MTLGRFRQTVTIDGTELLVRDVRVNDTADRVGTIEFVVERDVVGDAAFNAIDLTQLVTVVHEVDYPGFEAPLADEARTLTVNGSIVEVCDIRLGGGADGKRIRANTEAQRATSVRISAVWPRPEPDDEDEGGPLGPLPGDGIPNPGNPQITPDVCRDQDIPPTVKVQTVLQDLAGKMQAGLRIEAGGQTEVERITATRDTIADVLDELQRRTGLRWEIEGTGTNITLVWFNPLQRVGPPLKQPFDLLDGTLRVCKRSDGLINIVQAAAWEYRDVIVKDYGYSPYTRVGIPDPQATSRSRNFQTVDLSGFGPQRLHFSPWNLEGEGWEVVGEPCVRVFTSGVQSSNPFIGVPPTDVSDQYSARVHVTERRVEFRPTGIPPGGTGVAAFTVRRKIWLEGRDEASIAKFGPREGEPLDDDGGRSIEATREQIEAFLARKAGTKYELTCDTTRHGYEANTVIDVETDHPPLNRRMFVKNVSRTVNGTELTTQLQLADQELVSAGVGADVTGAIWPDTGEIDVGAELTQRLKRVEKAALHPSSPAGAAAQNVGVLRNPPLGETDTYGWGETVTVTNTIDPVDDTTATNSTLPLATPGSIL